MQRDRKQHVKPKNQQKNQQRQTRQKKQKQERRMQVQQGGGAEASDALADKAVERGLQGTGNALGR